jgi:transposase
VKGLRGINLVETEIEFRPDKITNAKAKLGRFILAINDLNSDPDTILSYYKGQQAVERGFQIPQR